MRYLRSSLIAGLVYCLGAPLVVHFVLPAEVAGAFARVFTSIEGRAGDAVAGPDLGHVALVVTLRLGFGFLTMALFCRWRDEGRWQAAYRAGVAMFVLTYVPLLAWFHFGHGLPMPFAMLGSGIGMVETMLAALAGAAAAGQLDGSAP